MHIIPSQISDVDILSLDCAGQDFGIAPEAVPFTVAIANRAAQTVALIGVRFDLTGPRAEKYSVVHYADMLRDPSRAELKPGGVRAICAEPSYTARKPDRRGRMNLENLRRMLRVQASLDCVAFEDGRFEGADSRGAFDRMNSGRAAEAALIEQTLAASDPRAFLTRVAETKEDAARVALARKLLATEDAVLEAARAHRLRVQLWRA